MFARAGGSVDAPPAGGCFEAMAALGGWIVNKKEEIMTRLSMAMLVLGTFGAVTSAAGIQDSATAERSTLVGCLQEDADSPGYVLTNAVNETSGSEERLSYKVAGVVPAGVRVSDHLDHQVRVTGAVTRSGERLLISMYEFEHVSPSCS